MRELSAVPTRTARAHCQLRGRGAAARSVAVDLTPQAVEQVAARVAQLLRERPGAPQLLSAGELARELRVERPGFYRHRHLLGGIRIGSGPKAQWRFERQTAIEALQRHQATERTSEDCDARPLEYPLQAIRCARQGTVRALWHVLGVWL